MLTTFHFLLPRDAQCGKLLCQGGEPNPLVPHVVTMDSTILLEGHEVVCRGAFVLPDSHLDQFDLGLVEPGTRCGPRMVSPAHPTLSWLLSPPCQSVLLTAQWAQCP